ncbi:2,5-diamino-6-ribosylamino-4(3H)-pyrimidinone 5'-phosphate reductase [Hypsizygus marmoreus]|uniref:2,5-diamino-6-ribosylamino-4(3H)-pyrimidinone 5'-phosphate reductase n=1 Tax=Hypsizygus marmoreus TaxID=39966 RepID=A0A369KAN0_HYPMA|nr:2,5-diamino-6-ribosylamino-4(3H)-pyrimidinone 5'-phosphate reductase [Hypsizygus marmoreus]
MRPSPPELLSVLSRYQHIQAHHDHPFVTLTFAQSLDAKIAGHHGEQLILSGKESMVMTHWMRTMHDAILVGIGTALNDDPQLNTRHLPPLPNNERHHLPRPVIMDTRLRLPPTCKLLTNYQNGRGRRPWVICAIADDAEWHQRKLALEKAGATVIQIPLPAHGSQLPIHTILRTLYQRGIRTLMVEGGARIIGSFFAEFASGRMVIDTIIVTVSPTFVGVEGTGYGVQLHSGKTPAFDHVKTDLVGRDAVMAMVAL